MLELFVSFSDFDFALLEVVVDAVDDGALLDDELVEGLEDGGQLADHGDQPVDLAVLVEFHLLLQVQLLVRLPVALDDALVELLVVDEVVPWY